MMAKPIGSTVKLHGAVYTLLYLGTWGNSENAWVIALIGRKDGSVKECLAKDLTFI